MATLDRRDWMKRLALVVGGSAAAVRQAHGKAGADGIAQGKAAPPAATAAAPRASGSVRVTTGANDIVETTAGRVRGFTRNGVHVFRGMPYGDTTAGDNRFLPPQKPKPWTGVRSSTSWGPVSPHPERAGWCGGRLLRLAGCAGNERHTQYRRREQRLRGHAGSSSCVGLKTEP